MKMRFMLITVFCLLGGCAADDSRSVDVLLKSNRLEDNMLAYYKIGEERDTVYTGVLLNDLNDPRVSNNLNFKGMSIYQCKIIALKKISNLDPPNELNYQPDSVNIKFYQDWAMKKQRDK